MDGPQGGRLPRLPPLQNPHQCFSESRTTVLPDLIGRIEVEFYPAP